MTGSTDTATASRRHDAMVAAYDAQRARLVPADDAWGSLAGSFKFDPRRPLDPLLKRIASYLKPDDTLLDVGGGAGRLSLPLALRCRDVIVIDPSPGMGEAFAGALEGSGIENARFVCQDWLQSDGMEGDITLVAHVTYFVPQIEPFLRKLQAATRRRVIVSARSTAPPNQFAQIFELIHGEEMAPVPGPDELLPVLDELGIAAEVIDVGPAGLPATFKIGQTREDAVTFEVERARQGTGLKAGDDERVSKLLHERFDELYVKTDEGFKRKAMLGARDLLITWEAS